MSDVKVGDAKFDAATVVELVSRVTALEQNQVVIRKDVDYVQQEVRDVAGAKIDLADTDEIRGVTTRLTDVEEQLERVFDEGYDPASQSQELVDCRKRIYAMEQSLLREDRLSSEERCLINMFRVLKKSTVPVHIHVDADGVMAMNRVADE